MADFGPSGFSTAFNASHRSDTSIRQTAAPRSPGSASDSPASTINSAQAPTRMPLRTNPASSTFAPPNKRIIIRADPTLVSCFDPADKDLYELWVKH